MLKRFMLVTLFVILSAVLVFGGTAKTEAVEVESLTSPGNFDSRMYEREQQVLYNFLTSEAAPLTNESMISVRVTAAELEELANAQCTTCGVRQSLKVGINKGVNLTVDLRSETSRVMPGANGGFSWTAAAESKKATALRFHITDFNLPRNAALFIYNADGEAFGPYRGRGPNGTGDFWTNTVTGSLAYLQVHHFGPASVKELKQMRFNVTEVAHLGEQFLLPFLQKPYDEEFMTSVSESFCSYNASCVVDASCYSVSAITDAKKAVAHMQFSLNGGQYICSGGLLNTTKNDQTPYFLTANHCFSTSSAASSLECYWNYKTSSCGSACYNPVGAVPRTLGATIVKTSATSDYNLLRLSQNPPAGAVFLGWSTTAVANSNGTALYRVSHPKGAPQAYSKHQVDTSKGTCGSWPRGNWIYSKDITGATEGGSSGSPVLNSSGKVVGQLSGACGTQTSNPCASSSNATVDGAFAAYYGSVSQYLNPGTTPGGNKVHVASINVYRASWWYYYYAYIYVKVVDQNGAAVSGATVSGTFSNGVSGSFSGTSGSDGWAYIESDLYYSISGYKFCVTNVSASGYSYNSSANVETCETY